MSIFEFREMVEQSIPAWVILVLFAVAIVFLVASMVPRR